MSRTLEAVQALVAGDLKRASRLADHGHRLAPVYEQAAALGPKRIDKAEQR